MHQGEYEWNPNYDLLKISIKIFSFKDKTFYGHSFTL